MKMKTKGYTAGGMMKSAVTKRFIEKNDAARKKYADRGTSGEAAFIAEQAKLLQQSYKSDRSIDRYGKDAPKARSFMSEDRPKKSAGGGMMKTKGYKAGGKLAMVTKGGKKVPAFAADGVGKMSHGGAPKKAMGGGMMKTKGYAAGGKTKKMVTGGKIKKATAKPKK